MKKIHALALTALAGTLAATALTAAPATAAPKTAAPKTAAPASVKPSFACASDPGSGDDVTRWNDVVSCVLGLLGQPTSDELINDVDIVIQYESAGDPNAINDWDSNAQAGTPSTGLVQVIQPTFDAYKSSDLADDIWDPAANIFAGMNYGIDRYGSIQQIPGVASVNSGGPYEPYLKHGKH